MAAPTASFKLILSRLLVVLAIIALSFVVRSYWLFPQSAIMLSQRFEQVLQNKEAAIEDAMLLFHSFGARAWDDSDGLFLFHFQNEKLTYWSSNAVPIEQLSLDNLPPRSVRLVGNGYYEVVVRKNGQDLLLGLILIKEQHPYENKYLKNIFQEDFDIQPDLVLGQPGVGEVDIRAMDETLLLSIALPSGAISLGAQRLLMVLDLLLLAVVLVLMQALFKIVAARAGPFRAFAVYTLALLALRWLSMQFPLPELAGPTLFDPALYATSTLFSSLGDLALNVLVLLVICWQLHKARVRTRGTEHGLPIWGSALSITGFLLLAAYITQIFVGLIDNSQIDHNINDVLGISGFTVISITAMGALLYALFLVGDVLSELSFRKQPSSKKLWILLLVAIVTSIFIHDIFRQVDMALVLWPFFILAIPLRVRRSPNRRYDLSASIALLVLASIFSAYVTSKYTRLKEHGERRIFAEKLSGDEDPIAELLFIEHAVPLKHHEELLREFQKPDTLFDPTIINEVVLNAFSGYWSKYSIATFCFGLDDTQLGMFDQMPERTIEEVRQMKAHSDPIDAQHPEFRYTPSALSELRYTAWLPIGDTTVLGHLYLEFSNKQLPEELGFPELLLAHDPNRVDDLGDYAFARYENGSLARKYGSYPYALELDEKADIDDFFTQVGYDHLAFQADENTVVLLSLKARGFLDEVTTFSYLFAYFSLVLFVIGTVTRFRSGGRFYSLSLRSKVQVLLVSLVLFSLLFLAVGLRYYITEQYAEKNNALIREKIHSVLIEVQHKMAGEETLSSEHGPYLDHILTKFSNVFFTDINLYDLNGDLLATSRAKVFKEGLISQKMDPTAYQRLSIMGASEFVHEEHIGELDYLSAYVPFQNENEEVQAYLNLPYFAKQNELESEVSNFLETIINAFVVLFALSILAGLAVTNWITRPLVLLRTHLSRTDLVRGNEPIRYEGSDEIADLVAEYNNKVEELKRNAEKLARSERESAWREMAKQVAHEIKNPLTPMKLSVQHFQRTWNADETDSKERLDRFTEDLVGQIEVLSNIANEFSNFAKMPAPKKEELALKDVLQRVVGLYNKSELVEIHFSPADGQVLADSDQMHRLFNNLVKNAIESIPEGQDGLIEVEMKTDEQHIEVLIRDNGVGIPEEQYEQIFVPNFTTRSTGMGLGLAMVKNIVEGSGGSVGFISKVGHGSSFKVRLPSN